MAALVPNSVLPDANIWVSQTLHSWFALIAAETRGDWRFYWTEDILAEALYHRRKRWPQAPSCWVEKARDRLMVSMGDHRIDSFEIDTSVSYPDGFDAHVHSAAVKAGIAHVVSDDRKGFVGLYADPDDCPYEVYTADEFLCLVADSAIPVIDAVIKLQYEYFCGLGKSFSLPSKLEAANAHRFADVVRQRMQVIV